MFVVRSRFPDPRVNSIEDLRRFAAEKMARWEHLGLRTHGWYLPRGRYDIVVVVEAPAAETIPASAAGIAGARNNRTETLRAFTLEEVEQVLTKVGSPRDQPPRSLGATTSSRPRTSTRRTRSRP